MNEWVIGIGVIVACAVWFRAGMLWERDKHEKH